MRSYTARDLVHVLARAGFVAYRSKGSHVYYRHPVTGKGTCIAMHPGDIPRGTAKAILKQTGLWEQEQNR